MHKFIIDEHEYSIDFLPVNEERFMFTLNDFIIKKFNKNIILDFRLGVALDSFSIFGISNCLAIDCWIKNKPGLIIIDMANTRITIIDKYDFNNKALETDIGKISIFRELHSSLILDSRNLNNEKKILTREILQEIELNNLNWFSFDNQTEMYNDLLK